MAVSAASRNRCSSREGVDEEAQRSELRIPLLDGEACGFSPHRHGRADEERHPGGSTLA